MEIKVDYFLTFFLLSNPDGQRNTGLQALEYLKVPQIRKSNKKVCFFLVFFFLSHMILIQFTYAALMFSVSFFFNIIILFFLNGVFLPVMNVQRGKWPI